MFEGRLVNQEVNFGGECPGKIESTSAPARLATLLPFGGRTEVFQGF
jgi:hypothetical protein